MNGPLLEAAEAAGLAVDAVPFIEIVPVDDPGIRQRIGQLAQQPVRAIFTSSNAVQAVTAQLPLTPAWSIVCLEGATREAVLAYWDTSAIRLMAPDAATLAGKIIQDGGAGKTVFFCGNRRLDHLPHQLKTSGIDVEEVIVYETRETATRITRQYDAVLFFSPSAVQSFFSVNTVPEDTLLVAAGTTTYNCLTPYTHNKIVVSPGPTAEAMIRFVTTYFQHEK